MNIDFWQAIRGTQARVNITRYEICGTCHGTGSTGAGEVTCPQCKGTGHVSQMAGAMKFNLTCPALRRLGQAAKACPTCGGDGRVTQTERWRSGSRRARATVRACACRAKAMPAPGRACRAISTSRPEWSRIRSSTAKATTSKSRCRWRSGRRRWARRSKCPTIDGRTLLKIPQGTNNGQKFRLREKGVLNSRTNQRGDQIVEVAIRRPSRATSGPGAAARAGRDPPRRSARGMWSKV